MATLSPSKPRTLHGCDPMPVRQQRSSPQRAAFVPRSALPEPESRHPPPTSSTLTPLSAAQAIQAFNRDDACDGTFLLSTEGRRPDLKHDAVSETSLSARSGREFDEETVQGSSEASVDIITERDITTYSDVRSASPRKPLPAQWFPSSKSPILLENSQRASRRNTKTSPSSSPVDRQAVRATRSSIDPVDTHIGTTSFLTKEALEAVEANIVSPTLRRSPSKIQRSPARAPWNSPNRSPKVANLRHSTASPTKSSPPRLTNLGALVTADHRRAPSSIVSTGATSFHTAHGSPVRSSACSQSSFSSAEDLDNSIFYQCFDNVADFDVGQVDDLDSKVKLTPAAAAKTSVRTRTSRPELSIRIPPSDAGLDAERRSASTVASPTSSTAPSFEKLDHLESQGNAIQSRIPRMASTKGSSARAPTLSSTLKQTKSTQTLRSPKALNSKTESKTTTASKTIGTKSLRHVCTVDSTGSTPILSTRASRDFNIPASAASVATTKRTVLARDVVLLNSNLEDTVYQAAGPGESLPAASASSRATSSSTVKASQVTNRPELLEHTDAQFHEGPELPGNINSSDADDELDDSTTCPPNRSRSAQDHSLTRRTNVSEFSMQSSSTSDLRATANEFIPTLRDTSENVVHFSPHLPDMYALDGYGIPWFYHIYPVPWAFPQMFSKARSKSPKKLRPRKLRSTIDFSVAEQPDKPRRAACTRQEPAASVPNATTCNMDASTGGDAASNTNTATRTTSYSKASEGPFSSQLDLIAGQAALQPKTNTLQRSQVDLTSIRNVHSQDDSPQGHLLDNNTVPHRLRHQRHMGNGLYGGRGSVGVPIYATAPFPIPVPPMGRPIQHPGSSQDAYVGYTADTQGCGIVEIEKAAEYGGGHACNTCEPDH